MTIENHKQPLRRNLPAGKVLNRALLLPGIASLVLAAYFAVTGEWVLAAIMALGVLSRFLLYPWYERRLASRDAAADDTGSTDTVRH